MLIYVNITDRQTDKHIKFSSETHKMLEETKKSKDALVKQFKNYLDEIESQLDDLKYNLTNGIGIVKGHCDKIRDDIKYNVMETIQRVNQIGEHMLQQLEEYEKTCVFAFETNKTSYTFDYHNLLAEMNAYNLQWENYVKQLSFDYNEMKNANLNVRDLKKRSVDEKKR